MNAIEAIYKFGNIYDKKTKKRIIIEDASDMIVLIQPDRLLDEDPNIKPDKLLTAFEKAKQVREDAGNGHFWKVFDAGKLLYFSIAAGVRKRNGAKENISCVFQVRLLEDLYIYKIVEDENKNVRFYNCHCVVEECLSDFDFFEKVYGFSISNVYERTYKLFFSMFGSAAANAFDRYFTDREMKDKDRIRLVTDKLWKQEKK